MSGVLVQKFQGQLDRIKRMSGSVNEQTLRSAFRDMFRQWCVGEELVLLEELEYSTKLGTKVYPDGTVVHDIRVPLGYWEAKDGQDDLDAEIASKTAKGYPTTNILYENTQIAVLIQDGDEVARADMMNGEALADLLERFFAYELPEYADFRQAVAQFKVDLPAVLDALREKIGNAYRDNADFKQGAAEFLSHARTTINPSIGEADVREMLIQHILTEDIFNHVFNESDFHRDNNVARQLYDLERLFFRGAVKKQTLRALEPYYASIRSSAASITAHAEKQQFLKVIYEEFYKVYNPDAADRLGVVYTPNEIVRFMIEGADHLCREHFDRALIDNHVDILDPCTGTGTYICELLEYFRSDKQRLAHKYKHELHANELAILPYYVANLNIEATYAAISGQYAEYPNLCFVDTLDNVEALGKYSGHQEDMFGAVSDENIERVRRQNAKRISVIIGNPPYNANQQNENDNNKNREYPRIDQSIKDTYVRRSTAQKTKQYDMYKRFIRWASDRVSTDGVVAYIVNRAFIDSRQDDGFRAVVGDEFSDIYVVDLGGDVRANPKLSGTTHNVFGIQTGVAILFMVKRAGSKRAAKIRYVRRPEMEHADDKLDWLATSRLATLETRLIRPSKRGNWVNQVENEWDELIPIASKAEKRGTKGRTERAIFELFSLGVVTARDEWVFARSRESLKSKVEYFVEQYEAGLKQEKEPWGNTRPLGPKIKWTRSLKSRWRKKAEVTFRPNEIVKSVYRPFSKRWLYFNTVLNEVQYKMANVFGLNFENRSIVFDVRKRGFSVTSVDCLPDYHVIGDGINIPRYRYENDVRIDNITDWALKRFRKAYGKVDGGALTKDDIFHYCYAVLHDPVYREIYAINLKREFPRIPFYPDFAQWRDWGQALMDMHIGYEEVELWPLDRVDTPKTRAEGSSPKPKLKSDPDARSVQLDEDTQLTGFPERAWDYRLGNRSAIDWVLDQHKEKKPRDPTIRESFNTYRFADYKEKVVDLLGRVARVSHDTVAITDAMTALDRNGWEK